MGQSPFHEPMLDDLLDSGVRDGTLRFDSDPPAGSEVVFICVGTPSDTDGGADLFDVVRAVTATARRLPHVPVVIKSTVPPGTAAEMSERTGIRVLSNPEFLAEGSAVLNFTRPDRVVIGDDMRRGDPLVDLYEPVTRSGAPIIVTDTRSAELAKYASNGMLAARISLVNEMANIAAEVGADIDAVRTVMATDHRIGPHFLYPGIGYGGSCFRKDLAVLTKLSGSQLLREVGEVNDQQQQWPLRQLDEMYFDLQQRAVGIWGLAFKPGTDDVRDAPSLVTIDGLLSRGARVTVHDPKAVEAVRTLYGNRLLYADTAYHAAFDADALIIHTEWSQYRRPNLTAVKRLMAYPVIIDGRHLFDADRMKSLGFHYRYVGASL
jgi:UDPglucose 6-dehydrogenase